MTPDHDRAIADVASTAVVMWRGEPLPFTTVPARIAETAGREERDRLFLAYREALEALNPDLEGRLRAWRAHGDVVEQAASSGTDPRALAVDLERFMMHSETPYYAALRRYLAQIGIEQGDATIADLWHVLRGSAWSQWFEPRAVATAVAATRRSAGETRADGWLAAEGLLVGGTGAATMGARAVDAAYGTLVGSSEWVGDELGMAVDEVPAFVDFATFVRLWRLRRDIGRIQYELRLFGGETDPAIMRAYYAGILGHVTGVAMPEEGYLSDVARPFGSVGHVELALLAASIVEILEIRHGTTWWRSRDGQPLLDAVAEGETTADALARLGYDALDWRPVLRQIRTRLIGEMSGYGGPNITTRAGTRKV